MKIKSGDVVKVISGSKNIIGSVQKVISVDREAGRVILENGPVNKKHMKPERSRKHPEGGIMEKPASVHVSNVMLMPEGSARPFRVGFAVKGGEKIRVTKGRHASGEKI